MDKLTEIKEKLNVIYKEYKDNKLQLNDEKTRMAAKLIVEMTFSENVNPSNVAAELARFSVDIVNVYFDSLIKSANISLDVIDEVLKELYAVERDSKLLRYYVSKYVFAITSIMKHYEDTALKSTQLPILVAFVAQFALKNNKSKDKFQKLINNTSGRIYLLDYSGVKSEALSSIWHATKALFPDLSKAKYGLFITEWAAKYGFITPTKTEELASTDNKVKIEESVVAKETPKKETPAVVQPPVKTESINPTSKKKIPKVSVTNDTISEKKEKSTTASVVSAKDNTLSEKPIAVPKSTKADAPAEKPVEKTDEKASNNSSSATVTEKAPSSKYSGKSIYDKLKRDMDEERKTIITAFADMITPIGKEFESLKKKIDKIQELSIENATLDFRNKELERQLSEIKIRLQENSQSIISVKSENEELRQQIASLESKNAELDSKLNDVYTINNRESSLEAEKVRSELKKAVSFLYEDWLDYEYSDVSEENYESLQAIIKKIFRSLERNGIDFKGNN